MTFRHQNNVEVVADGLGKIVGGILAVLLLLCLRAWLLSLCVSLIVPGFALLFWQWLLIAFTARLFFVSVKPS